MTIPNILSTLHDKCEILPPVYANSLHLRLELQIIALKPELTIVIFIHCKPRIVDL